MPKKVIHIVRKLLPFTASFIRNQISYYEKYSPTVVYTEKYDTPFFTQITSKIDTYYAFQNIGGKKIYDRFRLLTPKARKGLINFINEKKPDILHIHYGVDALVYAGIIKKLGIPTVVSFYGYDCTSFPKWFFGYGKNLLQRKVFQTPSVNRVFAMTPDMKKDLIKIGCPEEKIKVHYYGTETEPFSMEKIDKKDNETIRYLIISGLHEKKGHSFLIDALHDASKITKRKLHLDIIGDGPLMEALKKKITESGINNVILHGMVDYGSEKHIQFLQNADIFVHPSVTPPNGDKEGIPGAIIEAMACDLPIISTNHAGIPYVITNGKTGLLINEYDTSALSKALVQLAENDELRKKMGTEAQRFANKELNINIKKFEREKLYDLIINTGK